MKLGRNDICSCGSGKKYKKCCMNKNNTRIKKLKKTSDIIRQAAELSLEHDKKSIESAIEILQKIVTSKSTSSEDLKEAKLNLAQAYQHLGEHKKAISTLEGLEEYYDGKDFFSIHMLHMLAISYAALGHYEESCEMFDSIIDSWQDSAPDRAEDRKIRGIYLIEAGKSYSLNRNNKKAKECWENSISYLQEFPEIEAEHLARAKSNLAFAKLKSEDETIQEEGLVELDISSKEKLKIGDIQGLANNYCNLGSYFKNKKRYARAISYFRKDLYISRIVGNKRDIAITLGNLSILYVELKQYSLGRDMLREAKKIAEELDDAMLTHITEQQLNHLNEEAKKSGMSGLKIGDKAECACGSSKLYINCCGLADFEPVNVPQLYGGISEDAKVIREKMESIGVKVSPLDFILREMDEGHIRKSWTEHNINDGWISVNELPDMASLHLASAKEMAKQSSTENSVTYALSTVILSICHLEAFVNQLSFFLHENMNHPEVKKLNIPEDLIEKDAYNYQRTTNLESKWISLSNCINGAGWLESTEEWQEVKDLIYIRNELVHFKTNGFEQVVPPPRKKSTIYSKVPNSVRLRDEPHSWPFKILNESLASWAVDISEQLVIKLKVSYNANRRKK